MFKSGRWRGGDKKTIKRLFKLQFHASQVSQPGVDALSIWLVLGDAGKPTLRLEKAVVQEGSCRWENPIYETVKFVRDPKTCKISERIYHFIVSSGSSKAGVIGEVTIDFADYAEATQASNISLPLKSLNLNSNIVLHVLIRRLQDSANDREMEETEDVKFNPQDLSLKDQFSIGNADDRIKSNSTEGEAFNKLNNTPNIQLNSNSRASSGSDITLSSFESSSGFNTPRELALRNSNIHPDPHKTTEDASSTIYEEHQRSQWGWLEGSDPGLSTNDSTSGSQDTRPRQNSQPVSDIESAKLKAELAVLARQADMTELELQTLRKQIVKESKRGQDLSKEVVSLKEERNALKVECDKLKAFQNCGDDRKAINKLQTEGGDVWALLEEIRQELNYEKELNANLRIQIQKTHVANTELILAVQDLDEMLEQKEKEITNISDNGNELKRISSKYETDDDDEQKALEELVKQHVDAKDAYMLEQKIVDLYREIDIYRRDKDELEAQMEQIALDYEILKQENHDISYRLEQSEIQEQLKAQCECSNSTVDENELESQVDSLENKLKKQSKEFSNALVTVKELQGQVESLESKHKKQSKEFSDSLATIKELGNQVESLENKLKNQSQEFLESLAARKELESQVESLESELKKQSKEFSDSLAITKEFESHIMSLEEELEKQSRGFEADLEALTHAKVEQEQRAIQAEEALRRTRCKNVDTAERLQEEFRRLSAQMASMFHVNEKVAIKALMEVSELRIQKNQMEEMLQKANEEIRSIKYVKLSKVSNHLHLQPNQIEQFLEIEDKSKQLESQMKHKEELSGALSQEILVLKAEIDRLTTENNILSQQAEENKNSRAQLEEMKTSIQGTKMFVRQGNEERNELVSTIVLLKKEANSSTENLKSITCLKDEKETELQFSKVELKMLKDQYNNMKDSLYAGEVEKEKLQKLVLQLKSDLKKKGDAVSVVDKKLKDHNVRLPISDGVKTTPRNSNAASVPRSMKEVVYMRETIYLLEGQIKLKEAALETSTNLFLEKEKDLQNKIEELESTMEILNQNNAAFRDSLSQKESRRGAYRKNKVDEVLGELTSLNERNALMESELKEMQERYSEISLKFAEVEGERQRLVMTVRSLKNSKRTK